MTLLLKRYISIFSILFSLIQISQNMNAQEIKLPPVDIAAGKTFMQAVADRKSVREFDAASIMPDSVLGQLLWASVGDNRICVW